MHIYIPQRVRSHFGSSDFRSKLHALLLPGASSHMSHDLWLESVDVSMVTNEEIEPTSAASDATIDWKDTAAFAQGSRRKRLLRNRPITTEEQLILAQRAATQMAEQVTKLYVAAWCRRGALIADQRMPMMQIEANLAHVQNIPDWKTRKSQKDAYIMVRRVFSGVEEPVILLLDHSSSLTNRELHAQVRCHMQLSGKCSLRMCPYRPWYNYVTTNFPIPEHRAIPSNDGHCRHLFGTTVLCWLYVHLH